MTFNQRIRGRKTHRGCVAQTRKNHKLRRLPARCDEEHAASGGHAGINRIAFQGRFSPSGRLKRGRYPLVVTAINAAGHHSQASSLSFTIVK